MIRAVVSVVAFVLAASAVPAAGEPLPTSPAVLSRDTVLGFSPELVSRRIMIAPDLLRRAREVARATAESAPVVRILPPSEKGRAAVYAQRYRISADLALQIIESALGEGVDPDLAFRLIRVESVFQQAARSSAGALGLTQLMPSTARAIDPTLRSEEEILNPANNLRVGFRYLRRLMDRYGDVRLALLAYNRGETTVDRALKAGRDPGNGYATKVFKASGAVYPGSVYVGAGFSRR